MPAAAVTAMVGRRRRRRWRWADRTAGRVTDRPALCKHSTGPPQWPACVPSRRAPRLPRCTRPQRVTDGVNNRHPPPPHTHRRRAAPGRPTCIDECQESILMTRALCNHTRYTTMQYTVLDKSIRRLVRGAAGVLELKISA